MTRPTSSSSLAVCIAACFIQPSSPTQGQPPPIEISVRVPEPVTGEPGSTVQFDAYVTIRVGCDPCEPFAGQTIHAWTIALAVDGCSVLSATSSGTDFKPTERDLFLHCIDASTGIVASSGVFFSGPSTFTAPGTYTVSKLRCSVKIPGGGSCAAFSFRQPQTPLRLCSHGGFFSNAAVVDWNAESVTETYPPDQPLTFADSAAEACPLAPPGGLQLLGDCSQDGILDLSDAICLLGHLFLGAPATLPCDGGTGRDPGNLALLDANGDAAIDLSDPILVLGYLFNGSTAPVLGTACVPIEGCPELSGGCGI